MFEILRKNKYNDICYIENINGNICIETILKDNIWTIENPSFECIEYFKNIKYNFTLREYNNINFMMSEMAAEKIPEHNDKLGTSCIISFNINSNKFYILVDDNKPYIQNCGGLKKNFETIEECNQREIFEELNLDVKNYEQNKIGHWTYYYENNLINFGWEIKTVLFNIDILFDDIFSSWCNKINDFKNLIENINNDKLIILPIDNNIFDEINNIYLIRQDFILDSPHIINSKTFYSHHRYCLHYLNNLDISKFNISYLKNIIFY